MIMDNELNSKVTGAALPRMIYRKLSWNYPRRLLPDDASWKNFPVGHTATRLKEH